MRDVQASVLAVEAGQSLLFDRQEVIKLANKSNIIILGVQETAEGLSWN
jgi:hypothetical protein